MRVTALALLAAVAASVWFGSRWEGFRVSRITITGAHMIPRRAIVRAAGVDAQKNLWLQDMGAASRRVEALPFVRTARFHRRLPAALLIAVEERQPAGALLVRGGRFAIVDAEARVLELSGGPRGLPVLGVVLPQEPTPGGFLHDRELRRLLRAQQTLHAQALETRALRLERYDDLVAVLAGGTVVEFGDDSDLARKARLVPPILQAAAPRLASHVDLRAPDTPTVVYR